MAARGRARLSPFHRRALTGGIAHAIWNASFSAPNGGRRHRRDEHLDLEPRARGHRRSERLDGPAGGSWDVEIVAVTNRSAWAQLAAGKSEATMNELINTPNSGVLGPIPTNLYLFFNVVGH